MKIVPVILSGGSGTRLWPLSRKQYPKQYLPLAGDNTMLQETILRLSGLNNLENPIIMQAANGQRDSVSIFGNDYDTNDGTCIRGYIHVNDLANAHLKGLDYLNKNESSSAEFNLGNGNGFSVKEVIQQVKDITGKDFKVLEEGRRDGDPSTLIASDKKAKKELNLSPDYASLESIIKTLD